MFRAQQNAFDDAIGERQDELLPVSEYLMPVCSKGYRREPYLRELGVDLGEMLWKIFIRMPSLTLCRMFATGFQQRTRGSMHLQWPGVNQTDSVTFL